MAQVIADRRDIDFVLYEQFQVEDLVQHPKYADLNRKTFDMVISEARNLGVKEILPTYKEGDREGVRFESGNVAVPECFRRPYNLYAEGEWIAMAEDPDFGGQGLPHVIAQAAKEFIVGANFSFAAFGTLTHGTGKMIEIAGTPVQKKVFLKKLFSGQWAGTMLLTEPNAGSDVGALTTTAVKNDDGTYSLTGNKIFITCGDHDLTGNIIHPVLARIEGDAPGTKGISLFIVPKIWVNEDGSLGEPNDIVCTGIEEKLGIHASPTCSMSLGGKGRCRGLLLGEPSRGMQIMFHMMNEVRLDVGAQGFLHGSAAYLYALSYARERCQGRDITAGKDPAAPQVPIIRHPDVRRMLLWMKSYTEGMRSLIYYVAYCFDKEACSEDPEEKDRYRSICELLTPVVKAYCSERGFDICVQAMQVHGGYGYTKEYPVEQLLRDCKIASIYEGTNGIQAMDLVGRKLGMKKGAVFMQYLQEIRETAGQAARHPVLADLAARVEEAAARLGEVAMHLGQTAMSPDVKTAFAFAHPFLEAMGDVTLAWMLLWRATVALPKRSKTAGEDPSAIAEAVVKNKEAAFYDGQIKSAEYFIEAILPATIGKLNAVAGTCKAPTAIHDNAFGAR